MIVSRFSASLLVLASLAAPAFVLAQSGVPAPIVPFAHPDPRLAEIRANATQVKAPGQVALSPDGSMLAWTLRTPEGSSLRLTSMADPAAGKEQLVTVGASGSKCSSDSPVWAPDSQTLAFTSNCTGDTAHPDQEQVFLYSRAAGESKQLTHLTGIFHEAAFSPDGKSLAFLFVENATRSAGALAAMKPWSGVIGQENIEVQRLYGVDLASGHTNWISATRNLHVFEFGWAPDSREVTYIAANAPGENNWWVAKLYTETVGNLNFCGYGDGKISMCKGEGAPMGIPTVIFDPNTTSSALKGLQIAVPRFSPDGKQIAFIGGLMSDQGATGGDIWVVPATGGNPTDITPGIDGTPAYETWLNNSTVGFAEDRRGHTLLADASVDKRQVVADSVDDLGEVNISGGPIKMAISASRTGEVALLESGHDRAPEIFAGRPNALKQITHLNDGVKPPNHTESIEWTNEGFNVQGWLTYPKGYDASRNYPMIVEVHGGPSSSAGAYFGSNTFADLGYFVFAPNPRGSFGQGETFTAANRKDFGYGDLRDILAGMDTVEKKVSIDKHREGLTGWSYGGFMTMFAVTQTHRFAAAVAGAGLSDWLSYYGENSIDQWMVPFFGATVYDDPAVYAKSSAINYIKNVKTPTLVIVGDRDGECPAPQSFEFWHALRAEGVKTQLVVYPNEGHGFRDPKHIQDREARMVAWFAENMPEAGKGAAAGQAAF